MNFLEETTYSPGIVQRLMQMDLQRIGLANAQYDFGQSAPTRLQEGVLSNAETKKALDGLVSKHDIKDPTGLRVIWSPVAGVLTAIDKITNECYWYNYADDEPRWEVEKRKPTYFIDLDDIS